MWNPFRRGKPSREEKSLQAPAGHGGWWPIISESFTGAWQKNIEVKRDSVLSSFAVFSCVSLIAGDISKMPVWLTNISGAGIMVPQHAGELPKLLAKPNTFQTRMQFFENWVNSKLSSGNTYVIKIRNSKGKVEQLRILDPYRVRPLVSESGEVYYEVSPDNLSGLTEPVTLPAREIIHDRFNCLFHPLVGLSPIFACGMAATQSNSILENSAKFFQNGGKPSGVIVVPGNISEEQAKILKASWDTGYSGANAGKTALLSAGASYSPIAFNAVDSQTVEQLKMTGEIVCSVFHVPPYKAGIGNAPTLDNIEALEQQYFSQCLQTLIEAIELCLEEAFSLNEKQSIEFQTSVLLRMDTERRYTTYSSAVKSAILTPNEARRKENLPPVAGGDEPYLQQQNYSLAALARRDASEDPFSTSKTATAPAAVTEDTEEKAYGEERLGMARLAFRGVVKSE
ncbi:phage portal protein [Hafnia alvei]|uniref:phage portal protein n=1 Tax=Hafnia alvei TaxID=569 RepID=UPI001E4EE796|nr:phage portal protein [Hafnia alvei]